MICPTILRITPRERQLLDRRELKANEEVVAEINQLRTARGKPPYDPSGLPGCYS